MSSYRSVQKSQTLLINTQSHALEKSGNEIIKFGFGQSPFLPPQPVIEALRMHSDRKEYSSVQGDFELRELISDFHMMHNGLISNPENVLVAPGSKILIYNILLAHNSLDVLLPGPSWVSYEPQVHICNHNPIRIPTNYDGRWRISPESLLKAISKKKCQQTALILNYPGNPDGLTYSKDQLQQIAEIARLHNILIISDEIYGLLDHRSSHQSLATLYPENTITTTGLSKWCGAGGWRLGVALLSEGISAQLKDSLLGLGSETYSCAPMPVQMAAKVAYQNYNKMKSYLAYQTNILSSLSTYCTDKLNQVNIKTHLGEGGFYLLPTFESHREKLSKMSIYTSADLATRLLEDAGVATLPASAFGLTDILALRLAYVDFEESVIAGEFDISKHCPRVVRGIDKMTSWINEL